MSAYDSTLTRLHNSIGTNSAWLSWTNGSTLADGKGRMHLHEVPADALFPYGRIDWSYNMEFTLSDIDLSDSEVIMRGSFSLLFLDVFPIDVDEITAYQNYNANTSGVIIELLQSADGELPMSAARPIEGTLRTPEEHREEIDVLASIWEIDLGAEYSA